MYVHRCPGPGAVGADSETSSFCKANNHVEAHYGLEADSSFSPYLPVSAMMCSSAPSLSVVHGRRGVDTYQNALSETRSLAELSPFHPLLKMSW